MSAPEDRDARPTTPSIPVPSMGSIAYAAAREYAWSQDPNFAGEHEVLFCRWEELPELAKGAFEAAARAVGG